MKKISKFLSVICLFIFFCFSVGAQTVPSGGGGSSDSGTIPVPVLDHYSWAYPLADLMSYAQQSVRYVSGYTDAKTALTSSRVRWIDFRFTSPRSDGVVLAKDLTTALATNQFDVLIAESEDSFGGNINLADSAHQTLFNGGFWVNSSSDGKPPVNLKVSVTFWLASEIYLPVPPDLETVKIVSRDASGRESTVFPVIQNGRMRVPTSVGHIGTATATFADKSQISFNLASGMAEGEKQVTIEVAGEFASTYSFPKGATFIVLQLEEWELNNQGEYRAIFEPADKELALYASTPQRVAKTVRVRTLPDGNWSIPLPIRIGVAHGLSLPPQPNNGYGVLEAVFSFGPADTGGKGGGTVPVEKGSEQEPFL